MTEGEDCEFALHASFFRSPELAGFLLNRFTDQLKAQRLNCASVDPALGVLIEDDLAAVVEHSSLWQRWLLVLVLGRGPLRRWGPRGLLKRTGLVLAAANRMMT